MLTNSPVDHLAAHSVINAKVIIGLISGEHILTIITCLE